VEQLNLRFVRRWLWLLILLPVLMAASTYYIIERKPQVYVASSRLIVGPGVDGLSPGLDDLRAGSQLMRTYAELAKTRPVLVEVIERVGVPISPETLESNLQIAVDEEAQILTVRVEDGDPVRATNIANTLADMLLRLSPSGGESPAALLNEQMMGQASDIEEGIVAIQSRIELLEFDLDSATSAQEQVEFMEQLGQERTRLANARNTLALLYNSLRDSPTNQVRIIESANPGLQTSRFDSLIIFTAALIGAGLALGIALTVARFDDIVHSPGQLEALSGLPVLGVVASQAEERNESTSRPTAPRELLRRRDSEGFRMLGTKLPFSGEAPASRSLVISSVDSSLDAGALATNLAVVLSQTGKRVILLDANLHDSTVGKLLGIAGRPGMTQVLSGHSKVPELTPIYWAPGLSVIPSGTEISDSFAKLASPLMENLVRQLEGQADIVLIAAPPLQTYAESLVIASRADAVILLAHAGVSKEHMVADAAANLMAVAANVIGAVLVTSKSPTAFRFMGLGNRQPKAGAQPGWTAGFSGWLDGLVSGRRKQEQIPSQQLLEQADSKGDEVTAGK
jgi:Mrp family chromosome partitioning ATPase/capsular polysaccharide biosynthesis protein